MSTSITKNNLKIPPLENGDRLTRTEFETRYEKMSHLKKAELIEGIVFMGSPLRINKHAEPHSDIMGWLSIYKAFTPNLQTGDNPTVRLDPKNEPQPDAILRIETGGQSTISEDDYVEGSPELIVEIAASTVSVDLYDKLKAYQRNQVQEYLIWRVCDGEFDWFRLREGRYIKLEPDQEGIIKSEIYPGLWLDVNALLGGNLARVFEVLQLGIATLEHQEFVQKLSVKQSQE